MVAILLLFSGIFLLPSVLIFCCKNKEKSTKSQKITDEESISEAPTVRISCITLMGEDIGEQKASSQAGQKDSTRLAELEKSKKQPAAAVEKKAQEAATNVEQMNRDYPEFEEYCKKHRCVREPEMTYTNTKICKTCHDGVMWRCLARFYIHQMYLKEGVEVKDPAGNMKKFEATLPKFGWKWTGTDFLRIKRIKPVDPTQKTEETEEAKKKISARGVAAIHHVAEDGGSIGDYENLGPEEGQEVKTLGQSQKKKEKTYENVGPEKTLEQENKQNTIYES